VRKALVNLNNNVIVINLKIVIDLNVFVKKRKIEKVTLFVDASMEITNMILNVFVKI